MNSVDGGAFLQAQVEELVRGVGSDENIRPRAGQVDSISPVDRDVVVSRRHGGAQERRPKRRPLCQVHQPRQVHGSTFPPGISCRFDQVEGRRIRAHVLGQVFVAAKVGVGRDAIGIDEDDGLEIQVRSAHRQVPAAEPNDLQIDRPILQPGVYISSFDLEALGRSEGVCGSVLEGAGRWLTKAERRLAP